MKKSFNYGLKKIIQEKRWLEGTMDTITISSDSSDVEDFFKNDFKKYQIYEERVTKILNDFTKNEIVMVFVICEVADMQKSDITQEMFFELYDYYFNDYYETKDEAIKDLIAKRELCEFIDIGMKKLF